MECKICDKVFTGMECFKQHEASEKHQKKVRLHQQSNINTVASSSNNADSNSQILISIPCVLCSETFHSLSDFAAHSNSKEHMYMLKKKYEATQSEEQSPECDSTANDVQLKYEALKSDQSHPVLQSNEKSEIISDRNTIPYYSRCEPCNKIFSGPEPYQQHIDSFAHKKKCSIQMIPSTPLTETQQSMLSGGMSCDTCKKNFSGPVPYQQHMVSDTHKKKLLSSSNNIGTGLTNISPNGILNCEICDKKFTGPIPYDIHLNSDVHKKNVERNHYLSPTNGKLSHKMEIDSNVQAAKRPVGAIHPSYICEICNVPCSGPIPYDQHLQSSAHAKTKMKTLAALKTKEVQDLFSTKSEDSESCANQMVPLSEVGFNNSENGNINSLSTDLGSLIKDSLNLKSFGLTPEKLNMTFFKVDEDIDFDKMFKNNLDIANLEINGGSNDDVEEFETTDE